MGFKKHLLILAIATFLSACDKKCECVAKKTETSCFVTADVNPVCGCDGKTYGNESEANCAGIKKYTRGECKTD